MLKAAPIVAQPTPMDAVFKFDPLSAGGTAIFIAAIISIFILGVGIKKGIGVFAETLISLKWPILSIGMVLAFAFVTNIPACPPRWRWYWQVQAYVPVFLTVSRLAGRIPYRLGHLL